MNRQLTAAFVLLALAFCATANFAHPATLKVTNTYDSGPGSLRQAIATAAPNDTITFSVTGAISLSTGELVINKNLTITGPGVMKLSVQTAPGIDGIRI